MKVTSHAQKRLAERALPIHEVNRILHIANDMLTKKELKFSCGNLSFVARREADEPVLITAWRDDQCGLE